MAFEGRLTLVGVFLKQKCIHLGFMHSFCVNAALQWSVRPLVWAVLTIMVTHRPPIYTSEILVHRLVVVSAIVVMVCAPAVHRASYKTSLLSTEDSGAPL